MANESTLPERTLASTSQQHLDDHNTLHGIWQGRPIYNALDYGSSMNAARVQAAIDACRSDALGGIVLMPAYAGTYAFGSSTVNMDNITSTNISKVSLWGVGSDATLITKTGTGPAIFFGTSETGRSAPRNMSELRGFRVNGPGKSTVGSVGITIQEASYFHLWDVRTEDCETGFLINSGDSFSTGGNFHGCRANNSKYCYRITDLTGSPQNGEGTDHHFWGCYANGGYTAPGVGLTGAAGSVGFWLERCQTSQLFGCSVEASEVGFVLGNAGGTGAAARNAIYYPRYEVPASTAANVWWEAGIIYQDDDSIVVGSKGTWRDYTSAQANVLITKRDVDRTSGLTTLHRLVRTLDSTWDTTGSVTNGSPTLTTTNGIFTAKDVGRTLVVENALSGPANLTTTISAYTSATQVTMAANATRTASGLSLLAQAGVPTAGAAKEGLMLLQERLGSADRLLFYYTNAAGTGLRRDLLANADV